MSIANGLFLIIFMQRNGFILQYIFNSITKKHRFINGWFKLKDQSINRCFFVIEVKMYLSYIPLLINLFFCMKVMRERRQYPILMHPLYGIKSFLGYQHNYSVYQNNDTLGYYCNLCNIFIQLQNQLYILYMYLQQSM